MASLVELTDLEPGDAHCAGGGLQVDVGFDDGAGVGVAGDNTLQPDEIDQTQYVCQGADGNDGARGADGVSQDPVLDNGGSCSVSNVGDDRSSGGWAAGLLLFVGAALRCGRRRSAPRGAAQRRAR